MPVQRLNEMSTPLEVSEEDNLSPKLHDYSNLPTEETNDGLQTNQSVTSIDIDTPPSIPERTSASNLHQFKTIDPSSNKHVPNRRVTSPSSGNVSNPWMARKTSFQSERIVPNDDLVLSKARAAGTRNYSPRVSIFLFLKLLFLFCLNKYPFL